MWNSFEAHAVASPLAVNTAIAHLAAELRRSRVRVLTLESTITATAGSTSKPEIMRALQTIDLLAQELDAYAGICDGLAQCLPDLPQHDAAAVIAAVTLDSVKAGLLGQNPLAARPDNEAIFF